MYDSVKQFRDDPSAQLSLVYSNEEVSGVDRNVGIV